MDGFLKRRTNDARFALHAPRPEVALHRAATRPWYEGVRPGSGIVKESHKASIVRERVIAAEEKKKGSASDKAASSSSESDGEGGRKKKSKGNAPGYDGPDKCWDGYKKVPGKMRGESGSCEKA